MYSVIYEKQFYSDFDYWKKIVPGLADELQAVIEEIMENGQIPDEYNPHLLTNHYLNYTGNMEFHLLDGVKGGFELSFYGGLKMYDSGGLRIDRCQTV